MLKGHNIFLVFKQVLSELTVVLITSKYYQAKLIKHMMSLKIHFKLLFQNTKNITKKTSRKQFLKSS